MPSTVTTKKFRYIATDDAGTVHQGTMRAADRDDVLGVLRAENLTPGPITPVSGNPVAAAMEQFTSSTGDSGPKIKPLDLATVTKQFEVLLRAGQPPVRAIEAAIESSPDKKLTAVLEEIVDRLRQGETLAEAFRNYPRTFSESYTAYVSAAEESGALDTTFEMLYEQVSQQARIDTEVKSATAYPKYAGGVALIIALIMIVFLLPNFESMFAGFGAELPAPTQFLITVKDNIGWVLGGIIGAFVGIKVWFNTTKDNVKVGIALDKIKYRLPIFGDLMRKQTLYRWVATMSGLQKSNVFLDQSLHIAARASGSAWIMSETPKAIERIKEGDELHKAIEDLPLITKMVKALVETGAEAGEIPESLRAAGNTIATQVNAVIGSLGKRIEVLTMLVVMLMMGGIMGALWLPILQLSVQASENL